MSWILKLLVKRALRALLATVNPNSSTFWVGPANWIATYIATHFHWINLTPEQILFWLTATGGPFLQQILKKIFNGAFPTLTYGTLSPPVATVPVEPGTPVMATVAATPELAEKANVNEPTSSAKR